MKRFNSNIRNCKLWGEFDVEFDTKRGREEIQLEEVLLPSDKIEKYGQVTMETAKDFHADDKDKDKITVTLDNSLVTQTVEIMKQTEIINILIDTYGNKTEFNNCDLNPYQFIPNIDIPPETTEYINTDDKLTKPLWYIPPKNTKFSLGIHKSYPNLSSSVCKELIRKSLCGLLKIKGFNVATDNCLNMFVDSIDEFYRNFMDTINIVCIPQHQDQMKDITILTVEKAYQTFTQSSLTLLHNYYKNEIILRNHNEMEVFKDKYREYKDLMVDSYYTEADSYKEDVESESTNLQEDVNDITPILTNPIENVQNDGMITINNNNSNNYNYSDNNENNNNDSNNYNYSNYNDNTNNSSDGFAEI